MIDYRDLLMRYMLHVADNEGVTFIHDTEMAAGNKLFTPEQWDELRRLDKELEEWWRANAGAG